MTEPTLTQSGRGGPTLAQLEIDLADAVRLFTAGLIALPPNESGSSNLQGASGVDESRGLDSTFLAGAVDGVKKYIYAQLAKGMAQKEWADGGYKSQ
jgi:hypothetical protein